MSGDMVEPLEVDLSEVAGRAARLLDEVRDLADSVGAADGLGDRDVSDLAVIISRLDDMGHWVREARARAVDQFAPIAPPEGTARGVSWQVKQSHRWSWAGGASNDLAVAVVRAGASKLGHLRPLADTGEAVVDPAFQAAADLLLAIFPPDGSKATAAAARRKRIRDLGVDPDEFPSHTGTRTVVTVGDVDPHHG